MKSRLGFVSNSSSSSYVVYFPDSFTYNNILKVFMDEEVAYCVQTLFNDRIVEEYNDSVTYSTLVDALTPYVIASFDVGSDSGQIVLVDNNKLKEVSSRHEN